MNATQKKPPPRAKPVGDGGPAVDRALLDEAALRIITGIVAMPVQDPAPLHKWDWDYIARAAYRGAKAVLRARRNA